MPASRKPGSWVEGQQLRLRRLGAPAEVVTAEITRLGGYRARQALRLGHGWDQCGPRT
ncbi:hypothetical protein GZH49_37700 [Nocardia terpenica]|uniref:hypothetical protein n=1 Tax=Nocardia terpenica TaxID=455432 RepID=UPI002FE11386